VTFDAPPVHVFDVEAHRGGAGLWPENTLEAFGRALALGVSTLELDVHLTADDDVVVHHDPTVADARRIRELARADLPPSMPLLRQVAALLAERGADPVRVNLEIKYDALDASGLTTREAFVARVVDALRVDGLVPRTSIQCFDWGVLDRVGTVEPSLARNLLVSPKYLRGTDGAPSPWFDGLAVDDDFIVTAARQGFTAISPIHGSPFRSGVDDPAYQPFATAELVDAAHAAGLAVVPYVVDDAPTMRHLVRLGVDGLITNHPERLRDVLADEGRDLPPAFPGGADNLPPVRSVSST
jgi:glycerophosphoryl diester phosphodiesterase